MPKLVETQLKDQEYELLQDFKQENGLKTDYQGLKELVKSLDIPDFEAKRGRKGRLERAVRYERTVGTEFIERHFGESDAYNRSDKRSIQKRVMSKARQEGRKISQTDFDKWWFDPVIRKVPSGRQFGQEVEENQPDHIAEYDETETNGIPKNIDRTNQEAWVRDLNEKNLG